MWFDDFLYPKLPLTASRLCCIIPLAGLFYTPEELFPYLTKGTVYMIYAFFVLSALFCRFFYMMRRLYSSVRVFSRNEENSIPPENFYTFSHTVRFIGGMMLAGYYKFLWKLLFYTPSALTAVILINKSLSRNGMLTGIFLTLLVLTFCLFFTGLFFYNTVKNRYALVPYLLYINPKEPPDSIVRSSVLLTRGKLIRLTAEAFLLRVLRPLKIIPPVNNAVNNRKARTLKKVYGF